MTTQVVKRSECKMIEAAGYGARARHLPPSSPPYLPPTSARAAGRAIQIPDSQTSSVRPPSYGLEVFRTRAPFFGLDRRASAGRQPGRAHPWFGRPSHFA